MMCTICNDVYEEISGHSDIFYCKLQNKIICAPNAPIIEKEFIGGKNLFIAHIILSISVIQLIAESICAIVWMHKQSVNSLIFGISSIFFSVLISLYMWNLVYLNCG